MSKKLQEYKEKQHKIFGEFLHELKTPLAILRSHLESEITNETIPMQTRSKLVQDVEEISRMNYLINDVKFLLDGTNRRNNFTNESLLETMIDTIEMINYLAEEKEQKISLIANETFLLPIDKNRIKQLFFNLLSNAIKYTPKKGKIEIIIQKINTSIQISIKDDGVGIDACEKEKIFEAFYRVSGNSAKGTGLGLALCKSICDMHNAKIFVADNAKCGSTFTVEFTDE